MCVNSKENVNTISGPVETIKGSENAMIILPNCTTLYLEDALLSNRSKRNLLTFK